MAIGYYGVKLSGNVTETPEGYLVFKDAVIARTGFYTYKGSELLADEVTANELEAQGVKVQDGDTVQVYRSPEEVFSKKSIDSYQGKSATDGHPPTLLDLDSVQEHECGQIFNVRDGSKQPLENGDLPLLADIIVKDSGLIDKWRAGLRELSCGYNYHIVKSGNQLMQVDIIGNHVAFVENGRAGKYARVKDSQFTSEKWNMNNFLKEIRKRGFLAWATDAKPEEVAKAFDEMAEADKKEDESKAADSDAHVAGCKCADCKGTSNDAKAKDRARFHAALDKHMDAMDAAKEEQAAIEDADMSELKKMFGAKNVEESEEETAATDEEPDDSEGMDEDLSDNASTPIAPEDRPKNAEPSITDAAYREGANAVLKALKPFVAKSKDKRIAGAFDTATKLVRGNAVSSSKGSYSAFAKSAGKASDEAAKSIEEATKAIEDSYAKSREAKRKGLVA